MLESDTSRERRRCDQPIQRVRVVVATPLAERHCQLIERLEPRIDLIRDQSLYPPMRHPADFSGDPSFWRTPDQQQAFEEMVDSA